MNDIVKYIDDNICSLEYIWKSDPSKRLFRSALGKTNILDAKVKILFIAENRILGLLKLSYTKRC